jgi:NAD-dependent SIR2 family protein deacetylase
MKTKRTPVNQPPKELIEQIKAKNVVLFVGAGLSKSARVLNHELDSFPDYKNLLHQILERIGDNLNEADRKSAENYFNDADKHPDNLDKVARILREETGRGFYRTIREILEPIDAKIEPSMAHKLLRLLNFQRILTTNYDRLLERFVAPQHEMFTPMDLEAFRIIADDRRRPFIIKLHGDITRPDTIPFGISALYEHYGYDTATKIQRKDMSPETKELRHFLEKIFRENTVLFIGSSLSQNEGYAKVLIELARDMGGFSHNHYALVPYDPQARELREYLSQQMGIKYITYEPEDDVHSHVWEFIAFLNSALNKEAPKPREEWGQSYLSSQRPDYLRFQLEREKQARAVYFLTPTLTNAIDTHDHLPQNNRKTLENRYDDPAFINTVLDLMQQRRDNFEVRSRAGGLVSRVLFLESKLREAFQSGNPALLIERYSYLLDLMELENFEVRLIPQITEDQLRDQFEATYALIFSPSSDANYPQSDVTIAYASQATTNFFEIHIIQINSDETKDRVLQFERFWTNAYTEQETASIITRLIETAKGTITHH